MWAADVYGALHPITRQLTAKLAGMVELNCPSGREGEQRQRVWKSASAAIISRAAGQLARHSAMLCPLPVPSSAGCDTLGIPSGASARQPGAAVWMSQAVDDEMAEDADQNDLEDNLVGDDTADTSADQSEEAGCDLGGVDAHGT